MEWINLVYAVGLSVLLVSNIWLLREVDSLRRQLESYQREVANLDDRVCQLMYTVEATERAPAQPALVRGDGR